MPLTLLTDLWKGMEEKAQAITKIVGCLVLVSGTIVGFTTYFATAASVREQVAEAKKDAQSQINVLQQQGLEARRDYKDKELFDLNMKAKKQPLNDAELGRVHQLEQELKKIDEAIKKLTK